MQGTNGEVNTRPVVVASAAACEMNGMLIAGPTFFIASAPVAVAGGSPWLVALYLIACQIVTILGVAAGRETRVSPTQDMAESPQAGRPGPLDA